MTAKEIMETAGPDTRKALIDKIGDSDMARLQAIMTDQAFGAEFRVADVQARCRMTQAGASKLVQRLVAAAVIAPTRRLGKNHYYALAGGPVSIALGIQ